MARSRFLKWFTATTLVVSATACRGRTDTTAPPSANSPQAATAEDPLAARLERLEQRLEEARKHDHIPGMAIAVVKDGQMVYAKGFGVTNLQTSEPVTPQTRFAIGSSTKAFTSTAIGMLVDDGKMGWDDPIDKHVPGFQLALDTPDKSAKATVTDALCHRTGFTRMGVLWARGSVPRDVVLAQMAKAKPLAPFREQFLYNNVTYMAAGEAAARAAGMPWGQLIKTRILDPLGMSHTTTGHAQVAKDPRVSLGYRWIEDANKHSLEIRRDIDTVGPAGAIYSNVEDMAKWLQFQLAGGKVGGQALISDASLSRTRSAQIPVGSMGNYGLGWFLRSWKGKHQVDHGGNIDGFTSQVGMLPKEGIGFVLLTNLSGAPISSTVFDIVWDSLLGDLDRPAAGNAETFEPLVGKYLADFGPWKGGVEFELLERDGALHLDVPGQTVYELAPPDKDGVRPFKLTSTISVSFDEAADGSIAALRLHQSGLDFELLRVGYEPPVEVTKQQAAPLMGQYKARAGQNSPISAVSVVRQHGRLAVDVPGQMVFELLPEDADRRRFFRISKENFARFEPASGRHKHALVLSTKGQEVVFEQIGPPASAPSLDKIMKRRAGKRTAVLPAGLTRLRGTLAMEQAGVDGTFDVIFDAKRNRTLIDFGRFGSSLSVVTPEFGYTVSNLEPLDELYGKRLQAALLGYPLLWATDWRPYFDELGDAKAQELQGRAVIMLQARAGELDPYTLYLDAKTGDVVQVDSVLLHPLAKFPQTTKFGEFRKALRGQVPHRWSSSTQAAGTIRFELESIETGVKTEHPFPKTPPSIAK